MSRNIVSLIASEIKQGYDFIPFANWDDSEKGSRPAPYKLKQTYVDGHKLWTKAVDSDRVGIRLNNLILIDYDANKEGSAGEIPSTHELATALGFTSTQSLFDTCLIQYNDAMDSLHFLFVAPPEFNVTDFKQSNAGTTEHFWKWIDIKTGNQLVYLKESKTALLRDVTTYPQAPQVITDQLKRKSTHFQTDFDSTIMCSDHQIRLAEEWLHMACDEMVSTEEGGRNAALNTLAITVAGLVAGGALDNQASHTLLFESAMNAGCERSEVIATLQSAWTAGFNTPRRDAPYVKSNKPISEVFAEHVVDDTNIDTANDVALTTALETGDLDSNDPNIGILHAQYTYFRDNWVMNAEGRYVHIPTLASLTKTAFNVSYLDVMPAKPGSKQFKKFVPSDVFEMCKPCVVADTMYMPGSDRLFKYEGLMYLNSYIPYEPERPSELEIQHVRQVVFNHLNWLFSDHNHQRYMMEWLSWNVQRAGEQVGWLPLVLGCRGDGKSVLFELVTAALGSRNTKLMSNKSMTSDFQNWAVGSTVTAFEEIKIESKSSKKVANDLKPFITESRITVNRKGKAEVSLPNTANYIAFSNEPDPISISTNDRRWLVLETRHFGMNTVVLRTQTDMKGHFDAIKDIVNHEKYHPAIHHVLKEYVISEDFINHRYRAPQTVFSAELNTQTSTEREQRLQEYLEFATFADQRPGRLIDCPDGFQIQDFRPMMPDTHFSGMDKKPSAIVLGKWLRNLGYEVKNRGQVKTFKRGDV